MNKKLAYILIFGFVLYVGINIYAQKESSKLKQKQSRLNKQITETKNLLSVTQGSKENTLSEIKILDRQISLHKELIANIQTQINDADVELENNSEQISTLKKELSELKEQYANMILYAYKNRHSDHKLAFLLNAESVNAVYRRLRFIEQIASYQKKQFDNIKKTQSLIETRNNELKLLKALKNKSLQSQQEVRNELKQNQQKHNTVLKKLKADVSSLEAKLKKQESEKKKLALAIRNAIQKELLAQQKKNKKNKNSSKGSNKKSTGFKLSPEAKLASTNFAKNKGKLPWPVAQGTITSKYGTQKHDIVSSVNIENNGIDISTTKGASVRAVFNGKVSSVITIPGAGKAVIVSHGAYRTVYANLSNTSVKSGDEVKTKQTLGTLLPNETGKISESHFEVWYISSKGMNTQNPIYWLAK